jgi:hypothetical protein
VDAHGSFDVGVPHEALLHPESRAHIVNESSIDPKASILFGRIGSESRSDRRGFVRRPKTEFKRLERTQ